MSLSTHVLDTAAGTPAAGVRVLCERRGDGGWERLAERETDADGRVPDLIGAGELRTGVHRLTFATGAWAHAHQTEMFFPEVAVTFEVRASGEHHHVPVLLSPFGYTTYRGS